MMFAQMMIMMEIYETIISIRKIQCFPARFDLSILEKLLPKFSVCVPFSIHSILSIPVLLVTSGEDGFQQNVCQVFQYSPE